MKKRTLLLRILALALVLLGASNAHASLISWGYDWSATPSFVTAGAGKITLSNELFHLAVGNSDVVATNLQAFSTAAPTAPDTFTVLDGNYSLKLTIFDAASNTSGFLTFTGQLQGKFSEFNANVTNTWFAPTTKSLFLGTNVYTVTMNAYTPPGPPSQGNFGSIGAYVQVQENIPEPSTLILASLGLTGGALIAWRRRRSNSSPLRPA
jgi:hypothetical protein